MKFICRAETERDAGFMGRVRELAPLRVADTACLIEGVGSGVVVVPIGGKGEADASSGEPPDYYFVVRDGREYSLYGLRYVGAEKSERAEGCILEYNIESVHSEINKGLEIIGEAVLVYKNSLYERIGRKSKVVEIKLVHK